MRPKLPAVLLLLAVLGAAIPAAEADWLVLVGGKKIQTEGPWTLKGDLLTVHETTGRIVSVGTSTVDAAACLKLNGGSLRIEAVAAAPPPGAPVTHSLLAPASAGAAAAAKPGMGRAAGKATATGAPPPAAAATSPATPASAAAAAKARDDRAATVKLAKQAQLQRELRRKQIVDGCATMFVVDRVGFQRCVDTQMRIPPP